MRNYGAKPQSSETQKMQFSFSGEGKTSEQERDEVIYNSLMPFIRGETSTTELNYNNQRLTVTLYSYTDLENKTSENRGIFVFRDLYNNPIAYLDYGLVGNNAVCYWRSKALPEGAGNLLAVGSWDQGMAIKEEYSEMKDLIIGFAYFVLSFNGMRTLSITVGEIDEADEKRGGTGVVDRTYPYSFFTETMRQKLEEALRITYPETYTQNAESGGKQAQI